MGKKKGGCVLHKNAQDHNMGQSRIERMLLEGVSIHLFQAISVNNKPMKLKIDGIESPGAARAEGFKNKDLSLQFFSENAIELFLETNRHL